MKEFIGAGGTESDLIIVPISISFIIETELEWNK